MFELDRCVGSCNTLNDLSNKVCLPNKTEYLNLSVFNMITAINESKTSTKHISCKCKCRFDRRKCNLDQWWNKDKCQCECKKRHVCEKDCIWNPATCSCENGKYLASIMNDSGFRVMKLQSHTTKKPKQFQPISMKRKQPVKHKISIFYSHFC